MDRCIGRHVYSGCSETGGKGTRSCADLRTNAVKYVILSQRTELCVVVPIELQGSPRQRRVEEMAEMACGRKGPPAPGLQVGEAMTAKAWVQARSPQFNREITFLLFSPELLSSFTADSRGGP